MPFALSQITDKRCVAYMKDKNYCGRYIKPELGCNDGTPYEGRLVGNSPELNPLDSSLFADLTHALTLHICLTDQLDKEDARKFSTATPAKIEHAIDRLWCKATVNDVQHKINAIILSTYSPCKSASHTLLYFLLTVALFLIYAVIVEIMAAT